FDEISLPVEHVEALRQMIVSGNAEPIGFYPVHLIQLSTLGFPHNHTPISKDTVIPASEGGIPERTVPIFRFYIDGLVIHLDRLSIGEGREREAGDIVLGNSDRLIVSTVRYEGSTQRDYIEQIIRDAESWVP